MIGLSLLLQTGFAADLRVVKQWGTDDGLPLGTNNSLAIDEQGRLWVASNEGIAGFDGFEFTTFNTESTPNLPGNRVLRLLALSDGLIVQFEDSGFGHFGANGYTSIGRTDSRNLVVDHDVVWYIDQDQQRIRRWPEPVVNDSLNELTATAIRPDPHNVGLLVGTQCGKAYAYDAKASRLIDLEMSANNAIQGIAGGANGRVLLADRDALFEFRTGEEGSILVGQAEWPLAQGKQLDMVWSNQGWIIGDAESIIGTVPFRFANAQLTLAIVLPEGALPMMYSSDVTRRTDHHGHEWLGLGFNLYRDGVEVFTSPKRIRDFIVDDYDQVWLVTSHGGLKLLARPVLESVGHRPGQLTDPNVYLTTFVNGKLLVGGFAALDAHDPVTGSWTRLWDGGTRSVLTDGYDLLVGGSGLCRLSRPGECQPVVDFPEPTAIVTTLLRDRTGAIWAGTLNGLFRRTPGGRWNSEPLSTSAVLTGVEFDDGEILFGTAGSGVIGIQADASNPQARVVADLSSGLASDRVRALFVVDQQRMLVGLEDRGICLLDRKIGVLGCISTADGLPHHSTHRMILDTAGKLWVNTNNGIYAIVLEQLLARLENGAGLLTPRRFGAADGMINTEGNGGVDLAGDRGPDGRIWFPNQQGLVIVDPSHLVNYEKFDLRAFIRPTTPEGAEPIVLPPSHRRLEVRLGAIALADAQNVHFRYRLDHDNDWIELGPSRELNLNLMKPGRHRLQAQARYIYSDWPAHVAELPFEVRPRLIEHRGFHGLLVMVVLAGLLWLWQRQRLKYRRLRHKVVRRTNELNNALEQMGVLTDTIRQSDFSHQQAFGAVGRELKVLVGHVMQPLQSNSDKLGRAQVRQLRKNTLNVMSMIDQLASPVPTRLQQAKTDQGGSESGSTQPAAPQPGDACLETGVQQDETHPANNAGRSDQAPIEVESGWVNRVRAELLRHLDDPDFRVEQLAASVNLSRPVLYRRLQAEIGLTPADYIRRFRLEQAAHMLLETDAQITQIAYATGFRRVSAFTRAFARQFGQTPRHWRNANSE